MRVTQDRYETSINRHRTPSQAYEVGDRVLLSAKNIRRAREARKLDWKRIGLYTIEKVISPYAYCLKLPDSVHLHPVFHVSLLDQASNNPVPSQIIPTPPAVIIDDVPEYEIEQILDSKISRQNQKYFVKWTGYTQPTWEPASYHKDLAAVESYHHRYSCKPGPWN